MKLVVIESPYAGGEVERNVAYARECANDCIKRGESPYASHLFFTQPGLLDDTNPEERKLGIEAGLAWAEKADLTAVYVDRGISSGMKQGIAHAFLYGRAIEIRALRMPTESLVRIREAFGAPYATGHLTALAVRQLVEAYEKEI